MVNNKLKCIFILFCFIAVFSVPQSISDSINDKNIEIENVGIFDFVIYIIMEINAYNVTDYEEFGNIAIIKSSGPIHCSAKLKYFGGIQLNPSDIYSERSYIVGYFSSRSYNNNLFSGHGIVCGLQLQQVDNMTAIH